MGGLLSIKVGLDYIKITLGKSRGHSALLLGTFVAGIVPVGHCLVGDKRGCLSGLGRVGYWINLF